MSSDLTSIVVVTFNQEDYVQECLDSLLTQGPDRIELIITDDHSSDHTVERCRQWCSLHEGQFASVKILESSTRGGASANHARGFAECHGEFVKYIAGDDIILPGALDVLRSWLESHPDYALCCGIVIPFRTMANGTRVSMPVLPSRSAARFFRADSCQQFRMLCLEDPIPAPGMFMRRTALAALNEDYTRIRSFEDWHMWLLMTLAGNRIGLVRAPVVAWRRHATAASESAWRGERSRSELDKWYVYQLFVDPHARLLRWPMRYHIWWLKRLHRIRGTSGRRAAGTRALMVLTDPLAWSMSLLWLRARFTLIRIQQLERRGLPSSMDAIVDTPLGARKPKGTVRGTEVGRASNCRLHVCLFAPATSGHTRRIAVGLVERGCTVTVVTMHGGSIPGVNTVSLFLEPPRMKMKYLLALPRLKAILRQLKPDVLHAHYVSSYGFLGALTGFHPLIISAWGGDVYDFPRRGLAAKAVIKYAFARADSILSTSAVMAAEISRYSIKKVTVTPFGVDTVAFQPCLARTASTFVIGTAKDLKHVYGIDDLLKVVAVVAHRHPDWSLRLEVLGDGPEIGHLRSLVDKLGIGQLVCWAGQVPHCEMAQRMRDWGVAAFLSRQESYGVAALEAQACAIPVIVSDAPGLTEVVEDGVTGMVVPRESIMKAATAVETLYGNPDLRQRMGSAARNWVCERFGPSHPFEEYFRVYTEVIEQRDLGR